MAINYLDARLLWDARMKGASFDSTLTVAHLGLDLLPAEVQSLRQLYRAHAPAESATPFDTYRSGDYSDAFITTMLGATSLSTLDYSPYEGATIIHDLNTPIPGRYHGQFDAIIDGGSLEHVFNFPVAIASLMRMLKVGGLLFLKAPANNQCGHGFYQFSPELMYRVFAPENGFEVRQLIFMESDTPVGATPYLDAYEVQDPHRVGSRVGLTSSRPVLMLLEARKTADVVPFRQAPLQSDFVTLWNADAAAPPVGVVRSALRSVFARLPGPVQSQVQKYRQLRRDSLSNRRLYRKLPRV